jgi:predicted AAA+ superfamily ATPase
MIIERIAYISKLITSKDTHNVKIITGIRRVGKSTLLEQYKEKIINTFSISKKQIIEYDLNDKIILKSLT